MSERCFRLVMSALCAAILVVGLTTGKASALAPAGTVAGTCDVGFVWDATDADSFDVTGTLANCIVLNGDDFLLSTVEITYHVSDASTFVSSVNLCTVASVSPPGWFDCLNTWDGGNGGPQNSLNMDGTTAGLFAPFGLSSITFSVVSVSLCNEADYSGDCVLLTTGTVSAVVGDDSAYAYTALDTGSPVFDFGSDLGITQLADDLSAWVWTYGLPAFMALVVLGVMMALVIRFMRRGVRSL